MQAFAERMGFHEQLNQGLVPLCTDYALVGASASVTKSYASCNLHDTNNLMERITQLLPTDLSIKWSDLDRLFQRAGRKRTKKEMKNLPPNELSVNYYMCNKILSEDEKEELGGRQVARFKKTTNIRFR